ncbi:MAG: hypothetical protein RIA63_02240 [Cyclobacteriaceae bacterium]
MTVCFYTALHLVNAHLSKYQLQYRKHKDVNYALNFANALSPARLPEDEYIAYNALKSLSRKRRYLVNEKDNKLKTQEAFLTYDVHLARALRHLNKLLQHFESRYSIAINPADVKCSEIKVGEMKFFKKV